MLYKTIVLELLQQQPQMHEELRQSRTLMPTLNRLAGELKDGHEAWKARLPEGSENQAMELALNDLMASLPPESTTDDDTIHLDAAMAFLHRATLRA